MAGQEGTSENQTVDPGIDRKLQTRSIGETLGTMEKCSTFYKLLLDADLLYVLRRSGLHTLFAPRNEALPQPTPDDLEELLNRCLLPGAQESFDLRRCRSVKTADGETIPVKAEDGNLRIGKALIVRSDIPCTNGVIHVTDGLVSG
jgi:transforming growth factor-beta-induced protein